ncbi:Testis-specific gene 13 protein [Varanus komodoensis]|nr:Testis-specific gene 13 protein [Varanus komodoensis]
MQMLRASGPGAGRPGGGGEGSILYASRGCRDRWHGAHLARQQEKQPLPSIQGWVPKVAQWEPLTITCLAETKVTLTAPGEDGFRYGKAPLWVVETSLVPRNTQ